MILRLIRAINRIVNVLTVIILVVLGAYACYALWDNHQIYQTAENVQADMLRLKPEDSENEGPSFEELLKINPDVCAWVTMDNTRIDSPILQGETNLAYINTDVYGNFSLAGSLFLDTRCSKDFGGAYSLIYGHHMENGSMFGDLDLYKEQRFFEENRTGTLLLPEQEKALQTLACMLVEASEEKIFEPEMWEENILDFLIYVRDNSLFVDEEWLNELIEQTENAPAEATSLTPQIVVLSTCSSEFTNARTILVTIANEND